MYFSGSVPSKLLVYISMSEKNFWNVSGELWSPPKNTEAEMFFSSVSTPISAHICLISAWVPWRTELVEVWYRIDSRTPSLARTPSEPRTQPASSSSLLAPALSWVLHQSLAVEA
jgi:hypothetical protein